LTAVDAIHVRVRRGVDAREMVAFLNRREQPH
jgi:hypothetical protein